METGKRIGTHKGYWFHTIGQRKGLGLGGGPWFVIRKDIDENIIYVSHGYDTDNNMGQTLPCMIFISSQRTYGREHLPQMFLSRSGIQTLS